jgi:hypothetical protein
VAFALAMVVATAIAIVRQQWRRHDAIAQPLRRPPR